MCEVGDQSPWAPKVFGGAVNKRLKLVFLKNDVSKNQIKKCPSSVGTEKKYFEIKGIFTSTGSFIPGLNPIVGFVYIVKLKHSLNAKYLLPLVVYRNNLYADSMLLVKKQ